ncbi:cystathionine beta-lyase [Pseudomonas sp. St386]|nr:MULTISPECIES: cystathionine beta-lyase [Pseudomonas]AHL34836.1 cystathionine beta-lyase [Pseudomonas brassicacearum]KPC03348.1 Cystathionine beta-lyase [Pseudomonas syringae pv. maculicola]MBM0211822.1 cystathionine beta-lyase [Pseudomonas syringae pv. maculicola]PWJ22787.1 cystathionine beta-lyase [Pseudomonas sp. 43mfcvi1.1]RON04690.1 cystathionine beta-lyase [Pseudomonas brassicacearum]
MKKYKTVQTLLAHASINPNQHHGFVNTPVYRGSTVAFPTSESMREGRQKYSYGRWNNPSTEALTQALQQLEGAEGTVLCPSGLSACTTAILSVVGTGDHLLVADNVYAPIRAFCEQVGQRLGIEVSFYDPTIGAGIVDLLKPNTKAIYTESPGSLTLEIQDLPAIAKVAHDHDILVIADNTWGTPLYFPSLELGVDLSIMAATKYIVGHSDAVLGTVSASKRAWDSLKRFHFSMGLFASPDDVTLALRGMRTLDVRLERHYRNATIVAKWLETREEVKAVYYPALESHPQHQLWKRDFKGASGLLSFVTKPSTQVAADALLDSLSLFSIGYSWGGFESLAMIADPKPVRSATSWEVDGHLVRLHIGLEDPSDLISDLEEGFARFNMLRSQQIIEYS